MNIDESLRSDHQLWRKSSLYYFSVNDLNDEDLRKQIKAGWLDNFIANGDPIRGAAVLEIGHLDVEVNIYARCQTSILLEEQDDKTADVSLFTCVKHGEDDDSWESDDYITNDFSREIDWLASDWEEQLEYYMFCELEKYRKSKGLDYAKPVPSSFSFVKGDFDL